MSEISCAIASSFFISARRRNSKLLVIIASACHCTNRGRDRPEVAKGSKLTANKPMTYPDPRLTSFGYVLWQLSHTAQLRMTQSLAEINLTLQQLGVLIHLARGDASSTADLARITLTTPQNMSLTVAKLVAAGYVTRRPHEQH